MSSLDDRARGRARTPAASRAPSSTRGGAGPGHGAGRRTIGGPTPTARSRGRRPGPARGDVDGDAPARSGCAGASRPPARCRGPHRRPAGRRRGARGAARRGWRCWLAWRRPAVRDRAPSSVALVRLAETQKYGTQRSAMSMSPSMLAGRGDPPAPQDRGRRAPCSPSASEASRAPAPASWRHPSPCPGPSPIMLPMLVPPILSIGWPSSSSTSNTPSWANPRRRPRRTRARCRAGQEPGEARQVAARRRDGRGGATSAHAARSHDGCRPAASCPRRGAARGSRAWWCASTAHSSSLVRAQRRARLWRSATSTTWSDQRSARWLHAVHVRQAVDEVLVAGLQLLEVVPEPHGADRRRPPSGRRRAGPGRRRWPGCRPRASTHRAPRPAPPRTSRRRRSPRSAPPRRTAGRGPGARCAAWRERLRAILATSTPICGYWRAGPRRRSRLNRISCVSRTACTDRAAWLTVDE